MKRKIPEASSDTIIKRSEPNRSLSFPENGAEINAPAPKQARTSPASDTLTFNSSTAYKAIKGSTIIPALFISEPIARIQMLCGIFFNPLQG